MSAHAAYDELIAQSREQTVLASCSELLGWDEQTYMPRCGAEHRGKQMALLAGLYHERATDQKIGALLEEVESSELVSDKESFTAANVRELRRTYDRLTRLPRSLVEELALTTSRAHPEWVSAKKERDFAPLAPILETIFSLKRAEAECLGYEELAYDALLDAYEPGARHRTLGALFAALRADLVPLVAAIVGSSRKPQSVILRREYPLDRQRIFAEIVAASVGFDLQRGRLDIAEHPFCTGIGPGDTRITTRYDQRNFSAAFFGVLHEVGHALYDQGLEPEHHGTPMGEAVSLGIHESQSRLWENIVGRGRPFWAYWFPMARRVFADALHDVSAEEFYGAINTVEPSLIRVQADEVTYNLHVLIRFEIEQALLSGDLAMSDLPGVWNEKYEQYLGVTPEHVAEGCLQDVHWSAGLIGYFPTYSLGNMYAAQFFARASEEAGDLDRSFARGDFSGLLRWLRDKIHQHGQRYRADDLVRRVTGAGLDHRPLVDSLKKKLGELYEL
jgi:carboxypeptidase Taq